MAEPEEARGAEGPGAGRGRTVGAPFLRRRGSGGRAAVHPLRDGARGRRGAGAVGRGELPAGRVAGESGEPPPPRLPRPISGEGGCRFRVGVGAGGPGLRGGAYGVPPNTEAVSLVNPGSSPPTPPAGSWVRAAVCPLRVGAGGLSAMDPGSHPPLSPRPCPGRPRRSRWWRSGPVRGPTREGSPPRPRPVTAEVPPGRAAAELLNHLFGPLRPWPGCLMGSRVSPAALELAGSPEAQTVAGRVSVGAAGREALLRRVPRREDPSVPLSGRGRTWRLTGQRSLPEKKGVGAGGPERSGAPTPAPSGVVRVWRAGEPGCASGLPGARFRRALQRGGRSALRGWAQTHLSFPASGETESHIITVFPSDPGPQQQESSGPTACRPHPHRAVGVFTQPRGPGPVLFPRRRSAEAGWPQCGRGL